MALLPDPYSTTAKRVLKLTQDGLTAEQIAKRLQLSQKYVHMVRAALREEGLLPPLNRRKPRRPKAINYLPTPEEIEAKCAEFRRRHLEQMRQATETPSMRRWISGEDEIEPPEDDEPDLSYF